jgi:hypothetical protein
MSPVKLRKVYLNHVFLVSPQLHARTSATTATDLINYSAIITSREKCSFFKGNDETTRHGFDAARGATATTDAKPTSGYTEKDVLHTSVFPLTTSVSPAIGLTTCDEHPAAVSEDTAVPDNERTAGCRENHSKCHDDTAYCSEYGRVPQTQEACHDGFAVDYGQGTQND